MACDLQSIVIVHFDEHGDQSFRVIGGEAVRLFIVDERAPHDRVYEWLPRDEPSVVREIIPAGTEIGSDQDDRHEAVKARIEALYEDRSHLSVVE